MLNWGAIVVALCSVGGAVSILTGHPALAEVFKNPNTAVEATAAVTGIAGTISAFSGSIHPGWYHGLNPWRRAEREVHAAEERH